MSARPTRRAALLAAGIADGRVIDLAAVRDARAAATSPPPEKSFVELIDEVCASIAARRRLYPPPRG